jgi:hypothetical protein
MVARQCKLSSEHQWHSVHETLSSREPRVALQCAVSKIIAHMHSAQDFEESVVLLIRQETLKEAHPATLPFSTLSKACRRLAPLRPMRTISDSKPL